MKKQAILGFCFVVALVSCKKELINKVQFQNPVLSYDLAIEGGVNSLELTQFIKISKPAFRISDHVLPINDAQVFINDVELKIANSDGLYSTNLIDSKRYNTIYRLKIIYKGNTYNAEDTLKKVEAIDPKEGNIRKEKTDEKTFFSIPKHVFNATKAAKLFYQLPGQQPWSPAFFGASAYRSFIHTSAPPYGLSPVLEKRTNYEFMQTDSITVYKFSVSTGYEKFLYEAFQETDWKSLFSSTPGSIKGNISGNALGYFSCSDGISEKLSLKALTK
ncbi:hypothetical protein ABIB40_002590 [Pedobacter sp. UYP30]|uniref:hypothetical protein n=1 Tax=Pedobacter sp. UYP30 TaxID=1756400 RepID=UPI0033994C94